MTLQDMLDIAMSHQTEGNKMADALVLACVRKAVEDDVPLRIPNKD